MTACIRIVINVLIKFGCNRIKTVGEVFLKFAAPYGSVLRKNSKRHQILNYWQITQKSDSLYSPIVINVLIKFGCNRIKTVGEVFLKFAAPYASVSRKNSKRHHILYYWQITQKKWRPVFPYRYQRPHQIWLQSNQNCRRKSDFEICSPCRPGCVLRTNLKVPSIFFIIGI